jgi:hypothetical protein
MENIQAVIEDTFRRMKPFETTPEEQNSRREREKEEQTNKFEQALDYVVRSQFGPRYARIHTQGETTMMEEIQGHIQDLFDHGVGCYYSCLLAGGKTHILLEIFCQLARMEWNDWISTRSYPNAYDFIEKTCHYATLKDICDIFSHKEKVRIAKYNFIDGLGFEDLSYVLSNIENYFEEINRKGKAMVVTSKLHRNAINQKVGYSGILSIIYEGCRFFKLLEVDRRITKEVRANMDWRVTR